MAANEVDWATSATPAEEGVGASKRWTLPQLGLKRGLPKHPCPELQFLTFNSWWTEMGTKRYMEICFDLKTELFQVVLDKKVNYLNPTHTLHPNYDTLQEVINPDTKVLSMHLHEKLSNNQHAESLRRKHLQCWDLHVGVTLNILGRPTTLMQCNLLTGKWLEYHAERLERIRQCLETHVRKYETVAIVAAFASTRGKHLTVLGAKAPQGTNDLRQILNQISALHAQLKQYRPGIASGLLELAQKM